ncbi:MAG: NAD(P)-dependent oxidoreductase [Burkholderiaceae bacterium]
MKIAYLVRARPDLDNLEADGIEGVQLQVGEDGLYSDADLVKVRDADAFIIGMEPVNEQILAAAPRLKIVQRLGVGYETLDLEACARRNIPACNVEGVNKVAVAEHNMMFILALAKHMVEANQLTQTAAWADARRLTNGSFELLGKTLGIIGFGNTGSELGKRAHAFGMKLLVNDPLDTHRTLVGELGAQWTDKDRIYAESDIICICTDLNERTRHMINAEAFAKMQPHTLFICCARGGIVDENALADAIRSGSIAGAAIDVFEKEPIRPDNVLIGLPNVLLTSHVAGVARDTMARCWEWAHNNVRAVVERGERAQWIRNGL